MWPLLKLPGATKTAKSFASSSAAVAPKQSAEANVTEVRGWGGRGQADARASTSQARAKERMQAEQQVVCLLACAMCVCAELTTTADQTPMAAVATAEVGCWTGAAAAHAGAHVPQTALKSKKLFDRQQSTQWQPPKRPDEPAATTPPLAPPSPPVAAQRQPSKRPDTAEIATVGAVAAVVPAAVAAPALAGAMAAVPARVNSEVAATGEHLGIVAFKDLSKPSSAPVQVTLALKRVSDKTTDLALLRTGFSKNAPTVRVLVTELQRVEYWEGGLPGHFGPDGKHTKDAPTAPGRTANRDVEFAITTKVGDGGAAGRGRRS
jgi:hypothetical protein